MSNQNIQQYLKKMEQAQNPNTTKRQLHKIVKQNKHIFNRKGHYDFLVIDEVRKNPNCSKFTKLYIKVFRMSPEYFSFGV